MLARIKSALGVVVSAIKKVIFPTFVLIGQLVSSTGQITLGFPEFFKLLPWRNKEDQPVDDTSSDNTSKDPITVTAISTAMIITLLHESATRGPAIYQIKKPELPQDNKNKKTCCASLQDHCCDDRGVVEISIEKSLNLLAYLSGLFAALNTVQSGINFSNFLDENVLHQDLKNSEVMQHIIFAISLYYATSRFITYCRFNMTEIKENTRSAAKIITHGDFKNPRLALLTFLIAIIGSFGAPVNAFFSTPRALGKFVRYFSISENLKFFTGIVSACTATVQQLMSNVASVHKVMSEAINKKSKANAQQPPEINNVSTCEKVYRPAIKITGVSSGVIGMITSATSFLKTLQQIFNIDPKKIFRFQTWDDYLLLAGTILFSSISTFMGFTFGTLQASDRVIKNWNDWKRAREGYVPVLQENFPPNMEVVVVENDNGNIKQIVPSVEENKIEDEPENLDSNQNEQSNKDDRESKPIDIAIQNRPNNVEEIPAANSPVVQSSISHSTSPHLLLAQKPESKSEDDLQKSNSNDDLPTLTFRSTQKSGASL